MRRVIFLFVAMMLSVATLSAKDNGARISFVEKEYDFGIIKESDGPVSHAFEFKNVGNEPLIIVSANVSCGCTKPEYPKEPIKPGKKGKFKVTYNPAGRPGEFNRKVTIRTNDKKRRIVIKITGVVIPKHHDKEEE